MYEENYSPGGKGIFDGSSLLKRFQKGHLAIHSIQTFSYITLNFREAALDPRLNIKINSLQTEQIILK